MGEVENLSNKFDQDPQITENEFMKISDGLRISYLALEGVKDLLLCGTDLHMVNPDHMHSLLTVINNQTNSMTKKNHKLFIKLLSRKNEERQSFPKAVNE